MRRMAVGWSRGGMVWLALVVGLLWCTGIAMHLWANPDGLLELADWQMALRHSSTVLHGVLAWLICVLLGRWIWPHVRVVWHRPGHALAWALGLLSAIIGAVVAISGLFLLYGSPPLRDLLGVAHWWLGLAWPLPILAHGLRRWLR